MFVREILIGLLDGPVADSNELEKKLDLAWDSFEAMDFMEEFMWLFDRGYIRYSKRNGYSLTFGGWFWAHWYRLGFG